MPGFFEKRGAGPMLTDFSSKRRCSAGEPSSPGGHVGVGTGFHGEPVMPAAVVVAGIAHDLGNHLQIIASALTLINRGLDAPAAVALGPLVGAGLSALARASSLCRTLIGSGHDETCEEVTSLSRTLDAIRDLIALVTGPSITLEFIDNEEAPPIFCNALALENCILNLVGNATDAMPNGGRLTFDICREIRPDPLGATPGVASYAVLRLTDTGCGMSPETIEQIFLPFYTTKASGTGLGLANVRDFIVGAGGTFEVCSWRDAGTTVLLRLPEWRANCHAHD